MGLLNLFRKKEEKVHFVRDEAGNVVSVEREYKGKGSGTPVSDRLLSDVKKQKKLDRLQFKQEQREAYNKAFRKARLERLSRQGRIAGGTTIGDRLNSFANVSAKPSYSVKNNYNPFGSMFDTGMKTPRRSKRSSTGKKYALIGGKAYPIMGKTGSKKKKKKKSSSGISGGYDMFDNWGYMR